MARRMDQGAVAACRDKTAGGRGAGIRRLIQPRTVVMAMSVLALILVACGGASGGADNKLPLVSSGSAVEMAEDLAPNFKFTLFQGEDQLGGSEFDPASLRGRPLIINFWAGLCPPCRAELPDLQEFYNEFNDRVTLVGIDLGQFTGLGSLQDAKKLLEELDITYPVASTSDGTVISQYKVFGMPTTIFIDSKGEIFKNWGGALNFDVLQDQTSKMLSQ